MTFAPVTPFHIYLPMVKACLALYLNSVFTVKVLIGTLVGAFSVIVKSPRTFVGSSSGQAAATSYSFPT